MTARCTWWERSGRFRTAHAQSPQTSEVGDVVLHDDLIGRKSSLSFQSSTEVRTSAQPWTQEHQPVGDPRLMVRTRCWAASCPPQERRSAHFRAAPAEEMEALRKAGIRVRNCSGAQPRSAPSQRKNSLTHRQVSSAVVLVTGHHAAAERKNFADWPAKYSHRRNRFVYMPRLQLSHHVAATLCAQACWARPVAPCVSQATAPRTSSSM